MKKNILSISILILLSGCYFIPCNYAEGLQPIQEKIDEKDIYGVYIIEEKLKDKLNKGTVEVILKEDGSLLIDQISSRTLGPHNSKKEITSYTGNWRLLQKNEKFDLRVSMSLQEEESKEKFRVSGTLHFKKDKIVVLFKVGDPDECKWVRFVKK